MAEHSAQGTALMHRAQGATMSVPVPLDPAQGSPAIAGTGAANPRPGIALAIGKLGDEVVEAVGHHVRSSYVETFWLPVLGPSSTLLLRHISLRTEVEGTFVADAEMLGKRLGIGGTSKNSPLIRSMRRLVSFHAAVEREPMHFLVRTHLGDVPRRSLSRMPAELRAMHDAVVAVTTPRQRS